MADSMVSSIRPALPFAEAHGNSGEWQERSDVSACKIPRSFMHAADLASEFRFAEGRQAAPKSSDVTCYQIPPPTARSQRCSPLAWLMRRSMQYDDTDRCDEGRHDRHGTESDLGVLSQPTRDDQSRKSPTL